MSELKNNKFDRPCLYKLKSCASYLITLIAVSVIVVGAVLSQQFFEERLRNEKTEALTALLNQTEDALLGWHTAHQKAVASWARTFMVHEIASSLLKYSTEEKILKDTHEQEVLREILMPLVDAGDYIGFFIISKEKINLASRFGDSLGAVSNIPEHILDKALAGHAATSHPQAAKILLPDMEGNQVLGQPTMFTVAPIVNMSGEVIALLALRMDPVKDFSAILQQGRLGTSGESYVFSKAGQLMSESRFDQQLWDMGLLARYQRSILNVQLWNPAGNEQEGYHPDEPHLQQSLTLMAQSAIKAENGQNLKGYNDYRGVPVIGIWHWNEVLGMGITTEMDAEEAYATLLLSRKLMIFAVFLSVLVIIALNVVFVLARARLAKSEAGLSNAQRIAHLGSWDRNLTNNQLEWSGETYRIFQQDPGKFEPSYESFMDVVHPDDRETVASAINDALNGIKPYYVEHRVECPDGSEQIVLQQAIIERDSTGKPTYMHGSVLDITDRKKAEQELTLFKTTADMVGDSLLMFNPESLKFFYVNQATMQQLGYSEEELFNMTPLDIMPEFDSESFHASIDSLIKGTDKALQYQTVHRCKDGRLIPVDIALKYLAPKDEKARFVAIARDFSERQQIEDQLKNEKEKAEQATRSKSEFLANMSHEIRTPMNGVLGMMELMGLTPLSEKQQGYLQTAESSAKSLLTIINDILDFSKIEAGKMQLENTVFNLHEIVENSVKSLSDRAEAKLLDLNCYISEDVPLLVAGDPVRLRQIITNLVNNAIKFTAVGEVDFRLCKIADEDRLVRLCFEVEDTGIGIENEKLDSLFDAFSQADGSTTRKYGGTGLGLSICERLVSLMHGEMSVKSELGSGSVFSFNIAFSKLEQRVERRQKNILEDVRVLVVDHNNTNRTILGKYLSNWKIKNTGTGDSHAVLPMLRDALVNNKPYHVVLLDLKMPKVDGLKLVKMIKADQVLKNIHLILLGSLAGKEGADDSPDIDVYLIRPVRQSTLFDALLQVTGQSEKKRRKKDICNKKNIVFSSARVLLVDDVTTNRTVGAEMLNELGIEPVLADDGYAALEEIKKTDFDLVFMDCQMPVMDGYAATEIIRAQEKISDSGHMPIIALTANAMKGDRDVCISAGMDDYLPKPITLNNLYEILTKWLPKDLQHEMGRDLSKVTQADEDDSDVKISTASPAIISDGVLDSKVLESLIKLAGDRFGSLIGMLESDVEKNLPKLRDAVEKNDLKAIVMAVHAMKGAGANLAAIRFSESCKTLEMQARENQVIDAQAQVKRIEDEYQRAITKLREFS